jgi:LDH2 family malate/lactate/ureidoglycolate dehydrogenase
VERIWLPGEQSHGKRQRYAEQGIPVPVAVKKDLDALSAQLHIAPLGVL